jgi:hypothetical protein
MIEQWGNFWVCDHNPNLPKLGKPHKRPDECLAVCKIGYLTVAHTTRGGVGSVGRVLRRKRKR